MSRGSGGRGVPLQEAVDTSARRGRGPVEPIHGDVAPGFGAVADTFRDQFARDRAIGAACAVYRDGEFIVNL